MMACLEASLTGTTFQKYFFLLKLKQYDKFISFHSDTCFGQKQFFQNAI